MIDDCVLCGRQHEVLRDLNGAPLIIPVCAECIEGDEALTEAAASDGIPLDPHFQRRAGE